MMNRYYIIDGLQGFKGSVLSTMTAKAPEEPTKVDYSDGLTFEEYKKKEGRQGLLKLSEPDFIQLFEAYQKSLEGKLSEITEAKYWEMFEILPPMKYHQGMVTYFFVSEAYTGTLHGFYARYKGKYYTALRCKNTPSINLVNDVMNM